MKTIKIAISDQARLDLDFLMQMLEKNSMAETVEALITAAVPRQVELHNAATQDWPEFVKLRPARVVIPE